VNYGEAQPAADNITPEGRALNRRVVVVLLPKSVDSEISK
jgi:outer membrane protein OmpA-like peptidoglycan-associated protein